MRTHELHRVQDVSKLKRQLLQWSQQYREVLWLDSNDYPDVHSNFDALLAVDAFTSLYSEAHGAFRKLREYRDVTADWIFGYLSYDLKNDTEKISSENHDGLNFPELFFFQPRKLFILRGDQLEVLYLKMAESEISPDLREISLQGPSIESSEILPEIKPRMSREVYLEKLNTLQKHIHRGDVYEANFCQEFFGEEVILDPLDSFRRLNAISYPPFAAFLKIDQHYLLSASPERYIRKEGNEILSQPIKGTASRSKDAVEDAELAEALTMDPKERAENIMIVDLVRNDLSRTAAKGSVEVVELCKLHSFGQVHQLISTVRATIGSRVSPVDVLETSFPMGSMTGAPKISAMQLIEELEETKRGLYSGALGYFDPQGDFDFSVVIRSILYNAKKAYVSFSVGGAITANSIPEKEYEECILKARAMWKVVTKT